MNMKSINETSDQCPDRERLQKVAELFHSLYVLTVASAPKDPVQDIANGALAAVAQVSDYTAKTTLQAIAERMVQRAEAYDPFDAETVDEVQDLGLTTKLLIEESMLKMVEDNFAAIEMPVG